MFGRLNISQQGLIALLVLLASQCLFVGLLASELTQAQNSLAQEDHARRIFAQINEMMYAGDRCGEILLANMAMARSANERSSDLSMDTAEARERFESEHRKLIRLMAGLPDSIARANRTHQTLSTIFNRSAERAFLQSDSAAEEFYSRMLSACQENVNTVKHFAQLDASHTPQSLEQVKRLLLAGVLLNVGGTLILAWFFIRRITGRIKILTENCARFSRQQPLHARLTEEDEIGRIDTVFHQMAAALVAAANQERALIENSSDVICRLDIDGNFLFVSSAANSEWGYAPHDLLGKNIAILLSGPDARVLIEKIKSFASQDVRSDFEARVQRLDGQFIYTHWCTYWSRAERSLFCFVRDVEKEKRADDLLKFQELQLRNAIESLPVGIAIVKDNGSILSINAWVEAMLGHLRAELLGRSIADLFVSCENSEADILARLKENGSLPLRCAARQEELGLYVDMTATMNADSARQEDLLLVIEDVSERVKLEQMKQQFVTLLGENLQKPLEHVRSMISDQMDNQSLDERKRGRLQRVISGSDRLLKLIDELLNIEQLEAGKLVGELKSCSLEEVVASALDAVRDFAEQQKKAIEWQMDGLNGCTILADRDRLVQVIINLLSNAIKYSPQNTSITVACDLEGNQVKLRVMDRGRGVPPEMQKSIFEPYVQVSSADGARGVGTGLGLAICKTIVESHGGEIGVESREGGGSAFWLTLMKAEMPESK